MLHRLRSDFQLSILVLCGTAAIVGVLPLAIYNFINGRSTAGMADSLLLLAICAAGIYAWRTGDTRRPGLFLVVFVTIVGILMAHVLGGNGLFALFTIFVGSFFLVDRRKAAVLAGLALVVLAVDGNAFSSHTHLVSFTVNGALVSMFAFIFAARTETHSRQLEALATIDELTGFYNRRAMEHELSIAVASHKRSGATFGLVMIDIDHFKRVNDRYGHEMGDRILIAFAGLLNRSCRSVDRVFRFGGDEFLMLMPGADIAGLHTITTNLRARFAEELRGPGGPLTTSLGAAMLTAGEDGISWLARADAALYRAKHSGRNRAVVDERDQLAELATPPAH